ncbi:hypothetical protein [Streptomyces griseocarneus]|uniref:hypothetical protein n=1 Tax=Streptomyces griseocarneus TaxID=51201 RepID=UPI00167DFC8A|nr:hypothetical protein [Streptomyces griseocarneus]MBZ6476678.1 hypothetical protein [Streptomyces griseocarneus]GHG80277.1 hypothetical protein GCM10018779_61730 [Streptomyces griseocarneus]
MPHTVTGRFDDGSAYQVQITGDADRPVVGSARAAALVELHAGEPILLTPTGPLRAVSGDDEDTVLAVIRRYTDVNGSSRATRKKE